MNEFVFQVKNVKALVVDDNAVNLMIASNVLAQYGIEVDEANSGSMAIKKCYETKYDMIFMDYLMPGMNGVETIQNIRNLNLQRQAIMIALSANVSKDIVEEFETVGTHYVMSKPIQLKELSEVLKMYVTEEETEKENAMEESLKEGSNEDKISVLYSVTGLDVKRGLDNVMGDRETYIKVLNTCCVNMTEQVDYIKAGHKIISADGLKIYFHSLKGVLANIGAMELAQFSKKMESAALKKNEAYINENVTFYIEQIEDFRNKLKSAIEEYKNLNSDDTLDAQVLMDESVYKQKLDIVIHKIARFEFNEVDSLLEELISATTGQKKAIIKEAYEYIQQFQYEDAFELLREMQRI